VVSIDVASSSTDLVDSQGWLERRRMRKAERRRLARHDDLAISLLELHDIRAILEETIVLVNVGWIQDAWFAVLDTQGRERKVTAHEVHLANDRPVTGVCLVGGIVYAAGGPTSVQSQLVQRTLDLTWHSLHEDARQPVRWCPAPDIRSAHLRDLTRWNDHPQRTPRQVSALLDAAVGVADSQIRLRREQRDQAAAV
jgi:hypothetical protein